MVEKRMMSSGALASKMEHHTPPGCWAAWKQSVSYGVDSLAKRTPLRLTFMNGWLPMFSWKMVPGNAASSPLPM